MTSSVNPLSAAVSAGNETSSASKAQATATVDKQAFMTLLVAQLKNQDPLNPADGTQFLTQLAQFTSLEQLINLNSEVTQIREAVAQPAATEATDQPE